MVNTLVGMCVVCQFAKFWAIETHSDRHTYTKQSFMAKTNHFTLLKHLQLTYNTINCTEKRRPLIFFLKYANTIKAIIIMIILGHSHNINNIIITELYR